MTIGILKISLFLPQSNSLKQKRMTLHSLKARLRNAFNVSVAQLEGEDNWQRSLLAVVGVERNRDTMHSTLSKIMNYIDNFGNLNVIDYEMEMI